MVKGYTLKVESRKLTVMFEVFKMFTGKGQFDFYNELAEKYPESQLVYETRSGKIRKWFIGRLLSRLHGSLLDVGCNDYVYEPFWKGEYVGVDIARAVLTKGSRSGVWADVYLLPFKHHSFDYALCTETLEHLWHRVEALTEISRVLKDPGELFITVPHYYPQDPWRVVWTWDGSWVDLCKWGISPFAYLHGSFSLSYVEELAAAGGFQVTEKKILGPQENIHLYCKLRKKLP